MSDSAALVSWSVVGERDKAKRAPTISPTPVLNMTCTFEKPTLLVRSPSGNWEYIVPMKGGFEMGSV